MNGSIEMAHPVAIAIATASIAGLASGASWARPQACASAHGVSRQGLSYEIAGQGEPVVLIHAFSLDSRMWDAQVPVLCKHFRVIRYDLRAHGASVPATEPFAAHEDLYALLEELGIARAALVGLSAGARIATDFALAYPEKVTRLVLASPGVSGYVPKQIPEWMAPVIDAARSGDPERAALAWAATPLMTVPDDSTAAASVRALVLANAQLWGYAYNPERPLNPPALGRLSEIAVPVLVLVGERDLPDTHSVADTLAAAIPMARKLVVPGAPHILNLAAPQALNEAVLNFLTAGR